MNIQEVLQEVAKERQRQDAKWGVQRHNPLTWLAILGEEVGEVNKAVLENIFSKKGLENYREELIQVAAVAVAAIESLGDECVEDAPIAYKLMVSKLGVHEFEPITVIPSGSADHGKPIPFISVKDAFDWAGENLNSDLQKWFVEKIKD